MGLNINIDGHSLFTINDEREQKTLGTGFCFIKPNWVVTARHVVCIEDNAEKPIPRANLQFVSRTIVKEGKVLFIHPHHDLAVVQLLGEGPCKRPLFPGHEGLTGKNGLIICGYRPSKNISLKDATIEINWISSYEREHRSWSNREEHLINFEAPFGEPGNSGGPIFGEGGGVLAVVTQLYYNEDKQNRIRATSILPLLEHLNFNL